MAEVGISVAAKIAEYLVDPIIRRARYLFCFNNFVGDFRKAKTDLESALQGMKERAREATRNAEKVVQPVQQWLNDVQMVLEDAQGQEERVEVEASKSCLNVKLRYSLAKQMASKKQQMNELNKNSKIEPFSHPIELPRMKYFSSKDFVWFNSLKSSYDQLLKAMQDDKNTMIGLVGMGGSGKTTLAEELGKNLEELNLFDKVVMTVVSQNPKVRVIQGQIADQLSFKLMEETEVGRAQRLSERLKTEKILVILDDVWKMLDFKAIGIPLNENDNSCSILLTTRKQEVCTSMGCQSIIELSMLTETEGWTLFKQCAQIADDSPEDLREVGKRIANKCQGLLIAIVTVGSTLKGKCFEWWELALSRLENSQPIDVPEGQTCPYVCLRLSYDNLTNQLAKSLFLLSCMFPEDHFIHMEDLVRFGRGMLQGPSLIDLGTTRTEFNVAVNILVDCCLLMPTNEKEHVRMHDLVRDVALWIASKEGQAILVANKTIPRMLKEDEIIKDTAVISLWDMEKTELPHQLHCPALKILLHRTFDEYEMPNAYLTGRKDLKVLALIAFSYRWDMVKMYFWRDMSTLSIPQSMSSLTNLRTLCLRGYILGDISVLGSIKGLEILDLRGSSFVELPNEIGALNKLKLLDLYWCDIENNNPYEVITRCSLLQELFISARGNYCLENVSFPKLERYYIWLSKTDVSDFVDCRDIFVNNCGGLRFLRIDLEGFYASALSDSSIKDLFLRAEGLYLKQIQDGYKNIIMDMDKQHMNRLTSLTLESCSGIKCLVDTTTFVNTSANSVDVDVIKEEAVFSNLVFLWLHDMHDLEELFRGPSSSCSMKKLQLLRIEYCTQLYSISFPRNSNLCSLKILKLYDCPKLASTLFIPSIAQTLVVLEELYIFSCLNLKYIIAGENEEGNADYNSNQGPWSIAFGHLRILKVDYCDSLESLFPITFAQGLQRLEVLSVRSNFMLKSVFGTEKDCWLFSYQNNNPNMLDIWISMPALRSLTLSKLPELIHVRHVLWVVATTFGQLCNQVLPAALQEFLNLEDLDTYSLETLEGIFELQFEEALNCDTNREQAPLKLSSNLRRLKCEHLYELRFIWNGLANLLCLQRLRSVELNHCSKLNTIFSTTIVASLPELGQLFVYDCSELEEIISLNSEEAGELGSLSASSQQVCFPKLWKIDIRRCNKLKCIFSYSMACHCPSLQSLYIESCAQLDQVVNSEHKAVGDEGGGGIVHEEDGKHVLFPQLHYLKLKKLPNLRWIFPGYEFKSLHEIQDCAKLSSDSALAASLHL